MFCDLVGSTAPSTRHDPEDLRELIGDYHRAVAETVGRFDGFVAKYMGDGVLIYFGYPQAHEDDAERAVRAGLAVIKRGCATRTGNSSLRMITPGFFYSIKKEGTPHLSNSRPVLQALDGARIAAPEGAFPLLVVVAAAGVRALPLDLGDDRSGLRHYVDAQFGKPVDELGVDFGM